MTTTISNLPRDLIEEILSRVPLKFMRAVRLTCKKWDTLSKRQSFSKMHIAKATTTREGESMMIMMMDSNLYLMSVIIDDAGPSTKLKGKLTCLKEQIEISKFFHCQGLLLCIMKDDKTKVVIWNPYCGQIRWIKPRFSHRPDGRDKFSYAIGYEDKNSCLSFKFLRFVDYFYLPKKQFFWYEIYDFDSDSWKTLDVIPHWGIYYSGHGVSLKGNTYWCAIDRNSQDVYSVYRIICFDFTRERFGPLLPLPSSTEDHLYDSVTLCCVREEKLAALFQHQVSRHELEIWITTKIDPKIVSWSKFLRIDRESGIRVPYILKGFFIDEEKKVAMGFNGCRDGKFTIIGEDGYFRKLDLEKDYRIYYRKTYQMYWRPQDLCSYVPSLVQIKKPAGGERKKQNSLEKHRFDQNMLRLAEFEKPKCIGRRKMESEQMCPSTLGDFSKTTRERSIKPTQKVQEMEWTVVYRGNRGRRGRGININSN